MIGPPDREELVSVIEIADRRCSLDDCGEPVSATYSRVRTYAEGKVAYETIWACGDHIDELGARTQSELSDDAVVTGWLQNVDRVCLYGDCVGNATHVAFIARDYGSARRLEAMSLCAEHAERAPRDFPGPG